jgi:hypothetical protein
MLSLAAVVGLAPLAAQAPLLLPVTVETALPAASPERLSLALVEVAAQPTAARQAMVAPVAVATELLTTPQAELGLSTRAAAVAVAGSAAQAMEVSAAQAAPAS